MNLQQLRALQEVTKQGLSVSRAAQRLHLSQPVVSRHLKHLEDFLGTALFERHGRRLVRLTQTGKTILPIVEEALHSIAEIRSVCRDISDDAGRNVTIATVHTHGRLILPAAVRHMASKYPHAKVRLLHGHRRQVAEWVNSGEADFCVAPMPQEPFPELIFVPCHQVHVVVLCPTGHKLLKRKSISLSDIASHPIITYDANFSARSEIDRRFAEAGIKTNVTLTTTHADVIKQYVSEGFGIGLVADTVFDKEHDQNLRVIDARHLFRSNVVHLGVRRSGDLSRYARHLINTLVPQQPYPG